MNPPTSPYDHHHHHHQNHVSYNRRPDTIIRAVNNSNNDAQQAMRPGTAHQRTTSSDSDSSTLSLPKRPPYSPSHRATSSSHTTTTTTSTASTASPATHSGSSTTSIPNTSRASPFMPQHDHQQARRPSPLAAPYPHPASATSLTDIPRHRRQHSQGFFEPSLPSASPATSFAHDNTNANMPQLTASQIAAQAAMQHQHQNMSPAAAAAAAANLAHIRKRSQTVPNSHEQPAAAKVRPTGRNPSRSEDGGNVGMAQQGMLTPSSSSMMLPPPAPLQIPQHSGVPGYGGSGSVSAGGTPGVGGFSTQAYQNGLVGGQQYAATAAASVAYPRSITPGSSSGMGSGPGSERGIGSGQDSSVPEKEPKQKGSKMKLFSKPKNIGISKDKDKEKPWEKREQPLPSPNKIGYPATTSSGLSRMVTASSSSLVDSNISSNNSSMYTLSNVSSATILPANDRAERSGEKEKAHKHHFLSRQKLKLKDKDDHFNLPLSSASSNSKPLDPSAPQSLYSFAPSSPGPSTTTFAKSVSGLDLRHGGRALREKKREEKAAVHDPVLRDNDIERSEWPGPGSFGPTTPSSYVGTGILGSIGGPGDAAMRETLQGFGLNNMTPDDAWDFLKAKLLVIFEGEDVRIAVEDLNKLVSIHVQRCVQKNVPNIVVEDLRDLLQTGFSSLNHTLRAVPDERLVPHLVQMWLFVFGTILPYMQAVFLPLDLEFKGRGSVLSTREAREFWGAAPATNNNDDSADSTLVGDELDVRTIVLVSFRDTVILPRFEVLKATFSRLSLDTIHAPLSTTPGSSNSSGGSGARPGTAASGDRPFMPGSYNSQSSTLLSDVSGSRSRATSNTSAPDSATLAFHAFASTTPMQNTHPLHHVNATAPSNNGPTDSSHVVTETVARVLQCLSVLGSVNTADDSQMKLETLSKELKLNWLGRGRTGRNRRGFIGTRVRNVLPMEEVREALAAVGSGEEEGSRDREGGSDEAEENGRRNRMSRSEGGGHGHSLHSRGLSML